MTPEIILTLTIIVVAVILFATEKLRVDIIALLVLLTLALTGLVDAREAFAGFANPAVITVWAVYIVSGGLFRTGVADMLGERIARLGGSSEPRLIAIIMLTCGLISAFMNNIGATAVLLPAVVGISHKTEIPLSKLLIPLAFSSLMGGNMTMIGTPPNILATSILSERELESFQFFDFTPMGAIVFGLGILYMVLFGRHLLPVRKSAEERQVSRLRDYVTEVRVLPTSPLIGQTLAESELGKTLDLSVIGIIHEGELVNGVNRNTQIEDGDLLFVEGDAKTLMRARDELGIAIEPEFKFDVGQLDTDQTHVVEATLSPRSRMVGRTLREIRFRDQYGFTALALWHQGEVVTDRLRDVKLKFGDALLLKGPRRQLSALQNDDQFLVLEPVRVEERRRNKALISVGILALVLSLTTFAGLHISISMVIGSVLMVLTSCLTMDEAYQSIEWRSVFLIGGMLPLGTAMETTGTAQFLADQLIQLVGVWGPFAILAGIYILAGLITEPMSNAAATVLMVPIAIDIALELGASPQAFALATVIGASTSFLTPVGHQVNVLVFGPGGYRFADYTRVGWILNIVILIATLIFLPIFWPLFP